MTWHRQVKACGGDGDGGGLKRKKDTETNLRGYCQIKSDLGQIKSLDPRYAKLRQDLWFDLTPILS